MVARISASSRVELLSSRWTMAVSTLKSSRRLASSARMRSCWRAKNSNVAGSPTISVQQACNDRAYGGARHDQCQQLQPREPYLLVIELAALGLELVRFCDEIFGLFDEPQ